MGPARVGPCAVQRMVVAQASPAQRQMAGLPRRPAAWPLRPVGDAHASTLENSMTECAATKRLGKPDTGNPFVRFDEGRSGDAGPTTAVGSTCLSPLRLLYHRTARRTSEAHDSFA